MRKGFLDFFIVSFAKVVNGGLTVVSNIILLRHFGTEQFGVYSLCIVFIQLVDGTLGSALDMAVLKRSEIDKVEVKTGGFTEAELSALFLKCILVLPIALLFFFYSEAIAQWILRDGRFGYIVWQTVSASLALLLLRSYQLHCQLQGHFFAYGLSDLANAVLKFGGLGLILVSGAPAFALVMIPFVAGPTVVSSAALLLTLFRPANNSAKASMRDVLQLLRDLRLILGTFTLTATISRLDVFLLQRYSGLEAVGLYNGGNVLASIAELIGSYIGVVLNPKVKTFMKEGRLFRELCRYQVSFFAFGVVGFSCAFLAGDFLTEAVLPERFRRSKDIFIWLLPGALVTMAVFPLVLPFLMFVRPRFFLVMDLLLLPVLVFCYYQGISLYGAVGAAVVCSFFKVAKGCIAQVYAISTARSASFQAI